MNKTKEIVLKAIEDLRPYLHNDGGDMELVEITKDNKVIVKLLGACQTCSVSKVTLSDVGNATQVNTYPASTCSSSIDLLISSLIALFCKEIFGFFFNVIFLTKSIKFLILKLILLKKSKKVEMSIK